MTAAAAPVDDAWQQVCLISIAELGGAEVKFHALTETVKIDMGEKGMEGKPLVNGGRMVKFDAEKDAVLTFEAYALEAATDPTDVTAKNGKGFFDLMHKQSSALTAPIRITNNHTRTKYRVLFLWTNDPSATNAEAATTTTDTYTYEGIRYGFCDVYFIKVDSDFTDGVLKFTIEARCAAFDKDVNSNKLMESCAGSSATDILPAISAYTSTYKFASTAG